MRIIQSIIFLALIGTASLANALVLDSWGKIRGTNPPADNPFFHNIGLTKGGASCVYLSNGWVLTANHVGPSDVIFMNNPGLKYTYVPGSVHRFFPTDLALFKITPSPMLPDMVLNEKMPKAGDSVMMMGNGMTAGIPIFMLDSPIRSSYRTVIGYHWAATFYTSWGTNKLRYANNLLTTVFDKWQGKLEANAAPGDSGGALFLAQTRSANSTWALAGIIITIHTGLSQEIDTTYYGNLTSAVNLLPFNEEIKAIINGR